MILTNYAEIRFDTNLLLPRIYHQWKKKMHEQFYSALITKWDNLLQKVIFQFKTFLLIFFVLVLCFVFLFLVPQVVGLIFNIIWLFLVFSTLEFTWIKQKFYVFVNIIISRNIVPINIFVHSIFELIGWIIWVPCTYNNNRNV